MPIIARSRLAFPLLAALLCGLLATIAIPARPAQAAPVVTVIGTATNNGGDLTITTPGVAAGHSIVVAVLARNTFPALPPVATCSDPINGVYVVEIDQTDGTNDRVTVCALHNAAPASGSQISITNLSGNGNLALAFDVSGLMTSPLDQTHSNGGGGTAQDSGVTGLTNQAQELLLGVIGVDNNTSINPGDNGTSTNCIASGTPSYTSAGTVTAQVSGLDTVLLVESCLVTATGTYRASGSTSTSPGWAATITTYKADLTPPVVTTTGTVLAYTENAGAVPVDSGLTLTGPDGSMTATVGITSNFVTSEDSLGFTNQGGITGSYNPATGVLTVTGATTIASLQAALRTVTYTNSSEAPSTAPRTITFTVDNGVAPAVSATRQINVTAVNDPPTVTTTGSALSYAENAGAVPIDPGLTVADVDSTNLTGATVSITGSFQSAEDSLGFSNQNGISGSYSSGTGVLTLTGTATVATYQAALRSVTYTNSSNSPTTTGRTVSFQATDDTATASNTATRQISFTSANDPPVNTVPGAQTTPGNTPRVFSAANGNAISIADPDAGGADVQAILGVPAGQGTLTPGPNGTVPPLTTVGGSGTNSLTLVGSLAEINAALDGLTFTPPNGFTGTTTLTVTTNDQGNTGGPAQQDQDTMTINVGALPTLSVNDPAAVAEGDSGSPNSIVFTVTLSAQSNLQGTVPYTTVNQTATGGAACAAGVDYVTASGTLTFATNETSKTITVPLCGDTLSEGNETLRVDLSAPTNATLADGQAVGTITDDDTAGSLAFSAATAQMVENGGSVTLTVQRGGIAPAGAAPPAGTVPGGSVRPSAAPSPGPNTGSSTGPIHPSAVSAVTVNYTTANGTATAGQDYTTTSGTLSFGVGETTRTITIPILPDTLDEPAETFTVTLSSPSGGATLGATSTATVTITELDTTPCNTFLSAAVPAGTTTLPVLSQAGCNVGDIVAIDRGTASEEQGTIVGFGSILLEQPTIRAHAAGAIVVRVGITPASVPSTVSPGDDDTDRPRKETEEERRQRARTNQGGKDDDSVEGDVLETRCDQSWPSVVIANRDGNVEVRLIKDAQAACRSIQVGDYLEADGEKQHEGLFHADSVEIKRR